MAAQLEEVFRALEQSGARYLVVGGFAVVLHGYLRATADIDLIIDLAPDSVTAAIRALSGIGLKPRLPVRFEDFANPQIRESWIAEKGMVVFQLWDPSRPLRSVDVFVRMPEDFPALYARSVIVDLNGTPCRIASVDDLIRTKREAGRPRDLQDVEALENIKRARSDST